MSFIQENVSLKTHNTFGVEAIAKKLVTIESTEELVALALTENLSEVLVLGGGSNVLFVTDFSGVVLLNKINGVTIIREDSENVWVKVGGGESWDQFVETCVESGWHGLENLSAIPGTVGAAPIQNIGAYGVEMKSYFSSLCAVELADGNVKEFDLQQCQFGYRDSVFKHGYKNKLFITDVTFRLDKRFDPNLSYQDLKRYFSEVSGFTARQLRQYITDIRAQKLPDPAKIGNAGSFFKNPVLSEEEFTVFHQKNPNAVHFRQTGGSVKLAAGWLIDQCGLKGYRDSDAGIHDKQALVIVNHGDASGRELLELAQHVEREVVRKFGVSLEIEPRVL